MSRHFFAAGHACLLMLVFGSALALSACAVPGAASIDAPMDVRDDQPYRMDAGDSFKLTVYGEDTLTGEYTINQRGVVVLPMMGEVPAAGLTEKELQKAIRDVFVENGFLRRPLITIDARAVRAIAIIGEVKTPGNYNFRPKQDVFKMIAAAGGYTPRAAKGRVLITRWVDGKKTKMNANEDTPVLPGDSITVRERIF